MFFGHLKQEAKRVSDGGTRVGRVVRPKGDGQDCIVYGRDQNALGDASSQIENNDHICHGC